ncbi:MAG TPA: exodeoxyribonuclease VII small subunit [Anaerolineaceae bacterium]|nr:exodeoxyribonuclease VII small subunit [Anaerolineaceae bacterium]
MQNRTAVDEMSYEEAFAELEEIVRQLETDSRTLEESLALFERGQALAARCAVLLDQADLRIRQLNGSEFEPEND